MQVLWQGERWFVWNIKYNLYKYFRSLEYLRKYLDKVSADLSGTNKSLKPNSCLCALASAGHLYRRNIPNILLPIAFEHRKSRTHSFFEIVQVKKKYVVLIFCKHWKEQHNTTLIPKAKPLGGEYKRWNAGGSSFYWTSIYGKSGYKLSEFRLWESDPKMHYQSSHNP